MARSYYWHNEPAGGIGYFLDPPYGADRDATYAHDCCEVAQHVAEWARQQGQRPEVRIVLCGYQGDYDLPGWRVSDWKATGGYGNQGGGRGRDNAAMERLWLSPYCLPLESERQGRLL
jgi:hypothetical protein